MSKYLNYFLLLCSLALFCAYQVIGIDRPLDWDEVSYSNAAKQGIIKNATEQNSLNIVDFIRVGRNKVDNTFANTIKNKDYDEETDPFKLRHFHPVLPVYYWSFFTSDEIAKNNRHLRWSNVLLAVLFVVLLLICFAKKIKLDLFSSAFFFFCISLLITCTAFLESFTALNFHNFSLLAVCFYVFALMNYMESPTKKNVYMLGVSIAGLVLTLETAPFIIVGSAFFVLVLGFRKVFDWRSLAKILSLALLILLVLWPGIIFTGGPIKSWAMYAYRIFAVGNEEYSGISAISKWKGLFVENIFFLVVVLVIFISSLRFFRDKKQRLVLLSFLTGIFYALMMTPFMINHSYTLPAFGILLTGIFYWLTHSHVAEKVTHSKMNWVLIIIAIHALYITGRALAMNWQKTKSEVVQKENDFYEDVREIQTHKSDKPMFIDGAHVMRYYLGMDEKEIVNLELKSYKDPGFYQRVNFQYVSRETELQNKFFGVVALRRGFVSQEQEQKLQRFGYQEKVLHNYVIFY